ncbi:MAG TPA: exonuclease domain-containing protein [Chloroflexaceae bacterium]|nr:exonuclease domain-containing protein [Chloroflexaceae bacterium]
MFGWLRRREQPDFVRAYAAGPWPEPRSPWREVPYVVLDVETSGLDPRRDALLSIGMVGVEAGRVRLDRCWSTLVRPPEGLLVGGDSIRIHGLLRADLADAPPPAEVLPELLAQLRGRALVVHVAGVDVAFLNAALRAHYGARLRGPILDTARLAMSLHERAQLLGEAPSGAPAPPTQLRAVAERLGLPVFGEHDALGDALTTAQVFLAQATRLEQQGARTLRGLLRAGGV